MTDDDDAMMITSDGVLIRMHTAEISTFGRQTQGVRIMRLADDVKLVSMTKTAHEEPEEESVGEGVDAAAEQTEQTEE